MNRKILGVTLLFFLALYSVASISWHGNFLDGGNIFLTGMMVSSIGGSGAVLFYRLRMQSAM